MSSERNSDQPGREGRAASPLEAAFADWPESSSAQSSTTDAHEAKSAKVTPIDRWERAGTVGSVEVDSAPTEGDSMRVLDECGVCYTFFHEGTHISFVRGSSKKRIRVARFTSPRGGLKMAYWGFAGRGDFRFLDDHGRERHVHTSAEAFSEFVSWMSSPRPPRYIRPSETKLELDKVKIQRKSRQVIAGLKPSLVTRSVIASPDSRRIAYVHKEGSIFKRRYTVCINSTPGQTYGKVLTDSLLFSPDGERLAYLTKSRAGYAVVLDGNEGRHHQWIVTKTLRFSPDGAKLAYLAKDRRGFFWVIGEEEGMAHKSAPDELVFSPDGATTSYVATSGKRRVVFRDSTMVGEYDDAGRPVFSPDGKRFAYVVRQGQKEFVVLDGTALRPYEGVERNGLTFSPNSERLAYSAAGAGKVFVVIDGEETKHYDRVLDGPGSLVFSPNSERLAFGAEKNGCWQAIVDGEEFGKVDCLIQSTHAAKGWASARFFTFSTDSAHVVYLAAIRDRNVVMLDGRQLPQGLSHFTHGPVFSPDGQRLAYAGFVEQKSVVVLDGIGDRPNHHVLGSAMFFSPDSAHFAYMAARDSHEQFIVVDGVKGETYGPKRFNEGDVVFDSPCDLHYLVIKGMDFCLVHDSLEATVWSQQSRSVEVARNEPM